MRSGLIVREVRESIIGSRLGPALTVRFVRVHEGSLEARTPPHPPHPPAPLHPSCTPYTRPMHPMHTPCTRHAPRGAAQVGGDPRGAGARSLQLNRISAIEIDAPQAGHAPPNLAPSPTPSPTPRPRHTDPDTPSTGLHPHRLLPAAALLRQAELYVFTPAKGSRHELRLRFADSEAASPEPEPEPEP